MRQVNSFQKQQFTVDYWLLNVQLWKAELEINPEDMKLFDDKAAFIVFTFGVSRAAKTEITLSLAELFCRANGIGIPVCGVARPVDRVESVSLIDFFWRVEQSRL